MESKIWRELITLIPYIKVETNRPGSLGWRDVFVSIAKIGVAPESATPGVSLHADQSFNIYTCRSQYSAQCIRPCGLTRFLEKQSIPRGTDDHLRLSLTLSEPTDLAWGHIWQLANCRKFSDSRDVDLRSREKKSLLCVTHRPLATQQVSSALLVPCSRKWILHFADLAK